MRENGLGRSAIAVASATLPGDYRGGTLVPHQKRLSALVAAEHVLVLHKALISRIAIIALAGVLVAGGVHMRSSIVDAANAVAEAAFTGLASAGFGISAIDISGQALTNEAGILEALEIGPLTSLISYDAEAARARLVAMPAIKEASIAKAYPDRLIVTVSEKEPVARWAVDGSSYLVDASGTRLAVAPTDANRDLPLVIGPGAGDDSAPIVRALKLYPDIKRGVIALSRVGDRRWDILYDTGLRVQLPESGITHALKHLDALERDHAILERDLSLIDLRVPDQVVVRVTERDETEDSSKTRVNE